MSPKNVVSAANVHFERTLIGIIFRLPTKPSQLVHVVTISARKMGSVDLEALGLEFEVKQLSSWKYCHMQI